MSEFVFSVEGYVSVDAVDKDAAEKIFEDWCFNAPFFFEVNEFKEE